MGLLDQKIVVVTGGAGLLGREFCKAIVSNGGKAIVADIDYTKAKEVALEINEIGNRDKAIAIDMDTRNAESIRALITKVDNSIGRIDAVVNSAYPRNKEYGIKLEDVSYESFCENVALNLGGSYSVTKEFASYFAGKGSGNVVSISSIYGVIAPRFQIYNGTLMTMPVEYSVIKAGLQHLMKYMVKYYHGYKIKFNCVSPGGIIDKQPKSFIEHYNSFAQFKGILEPKDITGAVLFLLSDLSEWVNGQNIIVDDGWSL